MRVLCTLVAALFSLLSGTANGAGCEFPELWRGRWFQLGFPPITINSTTIDAKGQCLESDGDKFLFYDGGRNYACYLCVVIHEKHPNVLQYKEGICENLPTRQPLTTLCSYIPGDALLFSMFRMNADPVPCPFKGPFAFTYNRGYGECDNPVSHIDSCTQDSRLLLRYQACAHVSRSESTVEELVCLATWKEGSTRYLVGKLHHKLVTSDEDRYRCFVYDRSRTDEGPGFLVAQSGDATCNGIASPIEGSRTMRLTKVEHYQTKCRFPPWLTSHHHWHSLDGRLSFSVNHRNTTLKVANDSADDAGGGIGAEMRIACHLRAEVNERQYTIITHVTKGCQSGYVCMTLYRRDGSVVELQAGSQARVADDACTSMYFNRSALPYSTLIASTPQTRRCPFLGRYRVTGVSHEGRRVRDLCSGAYRSLVVGCANHDTMEFHSDCQDEDTVAAAYSCHGSWEDNGTNFLIASPLSRSSKGARRFCFVSTESERGLHFSSATESCLRNIHPGSGGLWAFNVTSNGQCSESLTGGSTHLLHSWILIISSTAVWILLLR